MRWDEGWISQWAAWGKEAQSEEGHPHGSKSLPPTAYCFRAQPEPQSEPSSSPPLIHTQPIQPLSVCECQPWLLLTKLRALFWVLTFHLTWPWALAPIHTSLNHAALFLALWLNLAMICVGLFPCPPPQGWFSPLFLSPLLLCPDALWIYTLGLQPHRALGLEGQTCPSPQCADKTTKVH